MMHILKIWKFNTTYFLLYEYWLVLSRGGRANKKF